MQVIPEDSRSEKSIKTILSAESSAIRSNEDKIVSRMSSRTNRDKQNQEDSRKKGNLISQERSPFAAKQATNTAGWDSWDEPDPDDQRFTTSLSRSKNLQEEIKSHESEVIERHESADGDEWL